MLHVFLATPGLRLDKSTARLATLRGYNRIAPILALIAVEHLGAERAQRIHSAISSGIAARERGHQVLGSLAGALNQP